jgi:hypothetical protein
MQRARFLAAGLFLVVAPVLLMQCSDDSTEPPAGNGDFAAIQTEIFAKSCSFSSCHVSAAAGNLVLTGSNAYSQLVGATPANVVARTDGLKRVTSGDPDKSLLWHKLNWTSGHHGADYGSLMPFGGPPLSVDQVEFVRRWIANGASETSSVVDRALLAGTTPQNVAPFTPLAPPANGYQMKVPSFAIEGGKEREMFIYRAVGNTAAEYVNRIEIAMRPGSHHFVAYTFADNTPAIAIPPKEVVRDLYFANGALNLLALVAMPYHIFMAGAQSPVSDYQFPTGVALSLPANASIDLNSHYVNSTPGQISGEVYMNLHTVPAAQVSKVAKALNLANFDITVPPGRDTTITHTFTFSQTRNVFMVTSHMHKHGTRFVVKIAGGPRNGEVIYTTDDWQHPPAVSFATPIVLSAGQGLTSEVTYRGDVTRTIRFGLTSDDEMGIIAGYWY